MQFACSVCSVMHQWQLGARPRGQSSTARAGMRCVFRSAFPGVPPSPPSPGGSGKTGRLSGGSPCATTHSLLRLPAKHRPVQRKFNARSVCSTCLACVQRVFATARDWQNVLDRACLSVRFSRLSERVRRYPMHELAGARRKPTRYFMYHLGRAFSFCDV